MNKRGQIAIFVIIAVIIVLGIAGFFLLKDRAEDTTNIPDEFVPLSTNIQNCVDNLSLNSVVLAGITGGKISSEGDLLDINDSYISWGYYEGEDKLPDLSEIEGNIENFIHESLPSCFIVNTYSGYEISFEESVAKAEIGEETVLIKVNYPYNALKGENRIRVNPVYDSEIRVQLGKMHQTAESIIQRHQEEERIDLVYLLDLDFKVDVISVDNKTFIYSISDENSKINNYPYIFRFANRLT